MDPFVLFLLAATGGIVKGLVNLNAAGEQQDQALEDLTDSKDYVDKQYQEQVDFLNMNFDIQQEEANKDAAYAKETANRNIQNSKVADVQTNATERLLSLDFNTGLELLGLGQTAQTLSYNNYAMQADQAAGSDYAALAQSGTRNSSLADAVEMSAANNSFQLQLQQDTERAQNKASQTQLVSGMLSGMSNVYGARQNAISTRSAANQQIREADDLIASYLEGGSNYRLNQAKLGQLKTRYDYDITNINKQITRLQENYNANKLSAFYGGAASGMTDTYNLITTVKNNWKFEQ